MNIARAIKQELEEGAIGDPLWVQMTWMLDRRHGADYFRRWHAKEEEGGSLLVHKSSHHFDLLRWWLNDNPENVTAMGSLSFYGKENAKKRKEYDRTLYSRYTPIGRYFESHPKTSNDETEKDCSSSSKNMSSSMSCSSCSCSPSSPLNKKADNDPFSLNLLTADRSLQRLYLDAEEESGYLRDQNVFGDHITIQDNMNVITETSQKQIHVSYSLITFAAEEGFHLRIVGTHGQLEAQKKRPDGMETSITGENGDEKHNRCQYNNSTIDKTTSQNDREVAEHDNEANENKNQTYSMICEDGGVHFGSSSSDRSSPTATSSRTPIQRTNVYAHNAHNDGNLLPKDDEYVRVWTTQSTVGEEGKVGQATRTKSFEDDKIGSYAQHSQTAQYAPASLVRRDHVTHQPEKGHKEADTKFINELFDIPEPHSEHEDALLSYPHSHSSSIASLEDGIWAVSWGHSALHSLKTSGRTVRIPQADSPALFSSSSNSSWNRKSLFTQKRR
jgi:predicted dehydrogenase